MAELGAFTFVLHSHLPYCREAGRWPHRIEEFLQAQGMQAFFSETLMIEGGGPTYTVHNKAYMLNQIARELLLLESSDWPFLIITDQAHEYATQRFKEYLARFNLLIRKLSQSDPAEARQHAELFYTRDNPFPTIDYRVFAERKGRAGSR